jgi:hypothetical protein
MRGHPRRTAKPAIPARVQRARLIDSLAIERKSRPLLEVFAMREDMMDIEMMVLEDLGPRPIPVLPLGLKTKTTKTTR